jgi:predicted ATPase/tetratricopeptide (TPR) repeat protein
MMTTDYGGAPPIRTPDQRLRVFVSSTLAELAPERAAVARAISALRLTPVMFELGARPHPPRELYRAYLAQSDVFVGLYWQRYGWIGPGMDISGLEDELRLSEGMPRLLYLKSPAPEQEPRLAAMIADLQSQGADSYRTFRSTRELGRLVRDDLALLLSERFATPVASAAPAAAPAADEIPVPRRSWPTPSTSLLGREDDIAELSSLLDSPEVRLVTLTGPGGIGKTRLAIAVGAALDSAGRRTEFVPLASITDPALVLPRVAASVGAPIEGTRSALDTLIEHFAQTPTLLVLDNLEQVTGAATELDQLLAACPDVTILATSRTVLRLRAERDYPVEALMVPAFAERPPLAELAALPAVRLFVDRARAVRHDFTLDDTNVAAVMEICRRLDGLPLAIELAAARTRVLAPAALLDRLEQVLDSLGTGPVDLPERQRTLRATVEWSFGLLDDTERELVEALSVFADGWTIEAATRVVAHTEDETLDLLDALAGHSPVSVVADDGGPRFRMLVTVRELAAERLAAGDAGADVARRHAEYFAELVSVTWPAERQVEWADRLGVEEENVRVAIRWFFTHDITPLPHMFRVLWLFWQVRDRMTEGRAWIDELRPRADSLDDHARAGVLFTWAVTAVEVGDDTSALAAIDAIERFDGSVDDPQLQRELQLAVAWTLPIRDDFDRALAAAADALDGFRRRGEPFLAFAELTVGMLEMTLGRADSARPHLEQVDELGTRYGNTWLEAAARTQLASLAASRGEPEAARALLDRSVDAIDATHLSTITLTFALVTTAQLARDDGDHRRAATALGAAHGLRQRAGRAAWPLTRRQEDQLIALVAESTGPSTYEAAFAAGAELNPHAALDLVRGDRR